jgi:hypothetical protein
MRAVKEKAPRVYSENNMNSREVFYMLAPIFGGIVVSLIALFSFPLFGSEEDVMILLLLIGVPLGIGIALTIVVAIKLSNQAASYGVRGVSRNLISFTVLYLDMLLEGYVDTGRITEESSPEEFRFYSASGFSAIRLALKRLDPENYKLHTQLFKEKKQANWSLREKFFNNYAIFALIFIAGSMIATIALQSLNLVPEYLTTIVLIFSTVMGLLLICVIGAHLRRELKRGPSEELERAILEPDLKTETHLILERLLSTLCSEEEHPLRLLTINEYIELTYTGHAYNTSRDITLREAVLIPRCFNR